MFTCLITGANRGIGLELARLYARRGATVLATARTPETATELAALRAQYLRVEILPLDVCDAQNFGSLAFALSGRPVNCLIANAGVIGPRGALDDPGNTPETWAQVFAVNVTGVYLTVRAFVPNIVAAGSGKIAIVSSRMASSSRAAGTSYLYRASKAAAANFGASLAVEMKAKGIAVGVYHPGWVKTDMGSSGADITATASAEGLEQRFDHLSLATTGVFEDYAGAKIAF